MKSRYTYSTDKQDNTDLWRNIRGRRDRAPDDRIAQICCKGVWTEMILRYNKLDEFWTVKKMESDFHVHFPQEAAGLLAHMANQKNIDITTLIAELAIAGLRSEQKNFGFKGISNNIDAKKTWSTFSNTFDESEWTWPDL